MDIFERTVRLGLGIAERGASATKQGAILPWRVVRGITAVALNEMLKQPHAPTLIGEQLMAQVADGREQIVLAAQHAGEEDVYLGEAKIARALAEAARSRFLPHRTLREMAALVNPVYFAPESNPLVQPDVAELASGIVRRQTLTTQN